MSLLIIENSIAMELDREDFIEREIDGSDRDTRDGEEAPAQGTNRPIVFGERAN